MIESTTELVTKLLAEGAKEFPHQWRQIVHDGTQGCGVCGRLLSWADEECPVLLRAALEQQKAEI